MSKECTKCHRVLPDSSFNKANWIKSGLRSDCKDCYAITKKKYWDKKGLDRPNARRERRLKVEAENGLRTCVVCSESLALTEENFSKQPGWWDTTCRPCGRKRTREWAKNNPERAKASAYARCAYRYAQKRHRTPSWLTKEDRQEMLDIYAECRRLRDSGIDVHVDHIIPLLGKNVSGLHVPSNLRIISRIENQKKGNKFDGTVSGVWNG